MSPRTPSRFEQRIADYERHNLESAVAPGFSERTLDGLEFIRVRGISAFWRHPGAGVISRCATDLALSAHGHDGWFVLIVAGTVEQVAVHVGIDSTSASTGTAVRLLQSAYPGLLVEPGIEAGLGSRLASHFVHGGVLTGVPGRAAAEQPGGSETDEAGGVARVIRGMRAAAAWAVTVRAFPIPGQRTWDERGALIQELGSVLASTRQNVQRSRQQTLSRTDHASQSLSEVVASEVVDREAQYLADLLQRQLQRLDEGRAIGRWQVAVRYGASDPVEARRLGNLLRSVFSGEDSCPDPVRAVPAQAAARGGGDEAPFYTALSSRELGRLIELPREEAPGYRVSDWAPFDVDVEPASRPEQCVQLGEILRGGTGTGSAFQLPRDDLAKHALVAGVTGSGKTTTVCSLLLDLHREGVPFLVVEPAKTEYRSLLGRVRAGRANGPIPRLRVFTLGNDQVAPFRINPFEFETDDDERYSLLLGHIDLLKAVFNAAFVLYAPMPYVLEMALHEVYEDKGWSLATGRNTRLTGLDWAQRAEHPVFPTLVDLWRKVEEVTRRLRYDTRVEQDVVAGLKARIGSLRVGAKGLMLDVPRGNAMDELLGDAAVLEMESLGNDSEKAFLIGLLFARLYERRRLQSACGALPTGLQHVVVIEEAHRLLRRVNTDVDTESANLRAQAVESLVNMLAEIRRYGQGVVLSEQVPTKLAPEAVKNTNLKVLHRVVAEDDRSVLAGATNMTDAQARRLATLLPGEAVLFAEGADHPVLVAVRDPLSGLRDNPATDSDVAAVAAGYVRLGRFLPVPAFQGFGIPTAAFGAPDPMLLERATRFLDGDSDRARWQRLLLRASEGNGRVLEELRELERAFGASAPNLTPEQAAVALRLVLVLGTAQTMEERGRQYGWPFTLTARLHGSLASALLDVRRQGLVAGMLALTGFAAAHGPATVHVHGPHPGCTSCPAVCRYGLLTQRLLSAENRRLFVECLTDASARTALERYSKTAAFARATGARWLGESRSGPDPLAYCIVLTAAAAAAFDTHQQSDVARQIGPHLL